MAYVFLEAFELNNQGVRHYAKEEWSRSLDCFKRGLQCIVSRVSAGDDLVSTDKFPGASPTGKSIASLHLSSLQSTTSSGEQHPAEQHSQFYDQPIVFEQLLENSKDSCVLSCAVLVFNMALAAHQRFRKTGDKISQAKALQLYDSSIDFFSKAPGYFDFAGIVSAALNNKAWIYFDESLFEELERDLAKLSHVILVANETTATSRFLDVDEFQGILLNLLLLKRPITAQAA